MCDKHEEEAIVLLGQSVSLIPTIIVSLERDANIIWGIDPSASQIRRLVLFHPEIHSLFLPTSVLSSSFLFRSIPSLFPFLDLLYTLTVPPSTDDPAFLQSPTVNLTDKLRQAPKREFNAVFEKFMVAFGRICYADAPEIEDILERDHSETEVEAGNGDGTSDRPSKEAERWVLELERAGGTYL